MRSNVFCASTTAAFARSTSALRAAMTSVRVPTLMLARCARATTFAATACLCLAEDSPDCRCAPGQRLPERPAHARPEYPRRGRRRVPRYPSAWHRLRLARAVATGADQVPNGQCNDCNDDGGDNDRRQMRPGSFVSRCLFGKRLTFDMSFGVWCVHSLISPAQFAGACAPFTQIIRSLAGMMIAPSRGAANQKWWHEARETFRAPGSMQRARAVSN